MPIIDANDHNKQFVASQIAIATQQLDESIISTYYSYTVAIVMHSKISSELYVCLLHGLRS